MLQNNTLLSAEDFKSLFRGHPGGVAVITATGKNGPVAMTATSVASVSVDPPMLIFSVSELSSAGPTLLEAETLVVHLLDSDDLPIAKLASTSGIDRFADQSLWTQLETGEVVYSGVRAWARCVIVDQLKAGGSTVIAAQALSTTINRGDDAGSDEGALTYHNRTWHRLGLHSQMVE